MILEVIALAVASFSVGFALCNMLWTRGNYLRLKDQFRK